MTERTRNPLSFSSLDRRRLDADFSGGALTSDAGALLLREADRRLGLIDALDRVIPDPRNQELISHTQHSLLAQRIFGIALGYEDLNDHTTLRHDPLWQVLAEVEPDADKPLASAPTLCRLENRAARRTLFEMGKVLVEQFIASFTAAPQCLVLDFDATDDPVRGHQEGRFFHGYYDCYCYLPLYVFCGQQLLCALLRPSRIDGARHAAAVLKLLVRRLRRAWPAVRIVFRGDSGFCRQRLMNWCERSDVRYVIGLARNPRLEEQVTYAQLMLAEDYERSGVKQRWISEFVYAAATWRRERRVVTRLEWGAQGGNPRFIVTNMDEPPEPLYDHIYCQRGEAENRIKEAQVGLFATRTSCHHFAANQLRVLLAAMAYVLIERMRALALRGTELATAQVDTLRIRLLKLAAVITRNTRRIRLYFASNWPSAPIYAQAMRALGGA